jgi:transposase
VGRSRGGLTSKLHAVVDANGLPVHLALTPGEAHDNRLCSVLLSALLPQTILLADRGYDADWIRELARQQGAWANIPPKRNRKDPICFSRYLYRARILIERFFNKIKQCRRVATRESICSSNCAPAEPLRYARGIFQLICNGESRIKTILQNCV